MPNSLHELVALNKLKEVEKELKKDPSQVNTKLEKPILLSKKSLLESKSTLLEIAISRKHLEMVQLLLRLGANISEISTTKKYSGFSMFVIMMDNFDEETIIKIINSAPQIDLNTTCNYAFQVKSLTNSMCFFDVPPIAIACINEKYELTDFLLKKGANAEQLFKAGDKGDTMSLFGLAALLGNIFFLKLLRTHKVNVNQPLKGVSNAFRTSALALSITSHITSEEESLKIVNYLIDECGADYKNEINGSTAILASIFAKRTKILDSLIARGADIKHVIQSNSSLKGITPLLLACGMQNWETVAILLKQGANANDICHETNQDTKILSTNTPLLTTAKLGNIAIFKLLVEYGGDVFYRPTEENEDTGRSVLTITIENNHQGIFLYALNIIANSQHIDKDEILTYALYQATYWMQKKYIELLLEKGARANQVVYGNAYSKIIGTVPLVLAAGYDNNNQAPSSIIELLVQNNADIYAVCTSGFAIGHNALTSAITNGCQANFDKLLKLGADLTQLAPGSTLPHSRSYFQFLLQRAEKRLSLVELALTKQPKLAELYQADIDETFLRAIIFRWRNFGVLPRFAKNLNEPDVFLAILFYATANQLTELITQYHLDIIQPITDNELKGLNAISFCTLINKQELIPILLKNKLDPHKKILEGPYTGLSAAIIALYYTSSHYDLNSLKAFFNYSFATLESKAALSMLQEQTISPLFAAIIFADIDAIQYFLTTERDLTTPMNGGYFKGESVLAAAICSGEKRILELVLSSAKGKNIPWQQSVQSDRFQSKTLQKMLEEKFHTFNAEIEQLITPPGKSQNTSVINTPINFHIRTPSQYRPSPMIFDIGDILSKFVEKLERKEKTDYFLQHIERHWEEVKKIGSIKKPDETKNLCIAYHLLRIFQALTTYHSTVYRNNLATPLSGKLIEITNKLRNLFMHDHNDHNTINLESVLTTLKENLTSIIEKEKNFLAESKKIMHPQISTDHKPILAIIVGLNSWFKSFTEKHPPVEVDYLNLLIGYIAKLKGIIDNSTKFSPLLEHYDITACKMLLVKIGECYQQLKLHSALQFTSELDATLAKCRKIRDKIGHEYKEIKIDESPKYLDDISNKEVISLSYDCITHLDNLEKLSKSKQENDKKSSLVINYVS